MILKRMVKLLFRISFSIKLVRKSLMYKTKLRRGLSSIDHHLIRSTWMPTGLLRNLMKHQVSSLVLARLMIFKKILPLLISNKVMIHIPWNNLNNHKFMDFK
jgi:hypothetical protein